MISPLELKGVKLWANKIVDVLLQYKCATQQCIIILQKHGTKIYNLPVYQLSIFVTLTFLLSLTFYLGIIMLLVCTPYAQKAPSASLLTLPNTCTGLEKGFPTL